MDIKEETKVYREERIREVGKEGSNEGPLTRGGATLGERTHLRLRPCLGLFFFLFLAGDLEPGEGLESFEGESSRSSLLFAGEGDDGGLVAAEDEEPSPSSCESSLSSSISSSFLCFFPPVPWKKEVIEV